MKFKCAAVYESYSAFLVEGALSNIQNMIKMEAFDVCFFLWI